MKWITHGKKEDRDSYHNGYRYTYHKRRSKIDWAGTGVGDAFRSNLDYYVRMPAQRLFYASAKKVQRAAAQAAGVNVGNQFQPRTTPQLSPCYTTYPSTLAALAALGLTAYLEYESHATENLLLTVMKEYLQAPNDEDELILVDGEAYKTLANTVARSVQIRLVLEDLSRLQALSAIEVYRLFSAAQQNLKFVTVAEIINTVVLYGDLLPDGQQLPVHPMTADILRTAEVVCQPFFKRLAGASSETLLSVGIDWVRTLCRSLARYLPNEEEEEDDTEAYGSTSFSEQYKFHKEKAELEDFSRLPALNKPQAPLLSTPEELADKVRKLFMPPDDGTAKVKNPFQEVLQKKINDFAQALNGAVNQPSTYEDMRYDLLEGQLRHSGFSQGPIQGNPAEGHEVTIEFGNAQKQKGEIFDRPVELSDNWHELEKLLNSAQPLTEALRRALYPNVEQVPRIERLRTSGSLDVSRLAQADFSSAVFKRYRTIAKADRRGRPVLLLACDGSGSLNHLQMRMLKLMSAAFLTSTARTDIEVLAGLYHSGSIRSGQSGPLVQWMYHPHKTPAIGRREAVRALVSLPESGTGGQSDALSIAFMMAEARKISRGRMIYFILMTDCAWNQSFRTGLSGKQEVEVVLQQLNAEMKDKLHTTLVALGHKESTGFENIVQKVITLSTEELTDYVTVAAKISLYVASIIQERARWIAKL